MGIQLTDNAVSEILPPTDGRPYVITYDGDHPKAVTGFGVRVTKAGARSFIFNYRTKSGKERRYTIGAARFKDGARWTDGWTATAARERASELRREIERGGDPMGDLSAARGAPTVADLAAKYLDEYASAKRSAKDDEGLLNQIILPEIGARKVAEIQYEDIERLHRKVSTRGIAPARKTKLGTKREPKPAPIRANRMVALLSKMFALAIRWKMRGDNPAKGIQRNHEQRRERYLSGDELGRLTLALAKHDGSSANVIRLLLLTGARRGEVLAAAWPQFDLDQGVWTKPSAHTKQKKEHRVPLSAPARQLLSQMKTGTGGDGKLFDGDEARRLARFWASISKSANISGVRVHDLRHTYASILASAGLSLPIIGALLGHTQPSTTARYAHLFDDPLRKATERVGQIVANAGQGATAEVHELPRHRGPRVPA